jgi:hypothetical protein
MNPLISPKNFRKILERYDPYKHYSKFSNVFQHLIQNPSSILTQAHFDELIDFMISSKNVILFPYKNNMDNFEAMYSNNKISTNNFTEIVNIWKKISNKEKPPLWYVPFLISKYEFNEEQLNIINQNPFLLKLYTIFTKDILSNEDVLYLINWYNPLRIIQMDNICGMYSDEVLVQLINKLQDDECNDVCKAMITTLCSKIQLEKYDTILNFYLKSETPKLYIMVLLVNIFNLEITTEDLYVMITKDYWCALVWSIVCKKATYDYVIYIHLYMNEYIWKTDCKRAMMNDTGYDDTIDYDNFVEKYNYFVNDNISEILYFIDIGKPEKAIEFINKNNIQITYEYIYDKYICITLPHTGHNMSILLFFLQYKIIFDKQMFISYVLSIKGLTYEIFLIFNNNGMVFDLEIFEILCKYEVIINDLGSRELDLQEVLNICNKYTFHPPEYSSVFYNNKTLHDKYICSTTSNLRFIINNIETYTDELIVLLYKYNKKIYGKLYALHKIEPPLAILLFKNNLNNNDKQIILKTIKNNGLYLPTEFIS